MLLTILAFPIDKNNETIKKWFNGFTYFVDISLTRKHIKMNKAK